MAPDDHAYLQRRADAELECARRASHPAAMRAHYLLLGYYLNKLFPGGDDPAGPDEPGAISLEERGAPGRGSA